MPLYHIVLFRLKPSTPVESLNEFKRRAAAMVSQVPGLLRIDINSPWPDTAHRSRGYNMGLVAVLEKAEDIAGYATHPAHLYTHELRNEICEDDTLAYDLEFPA
ncbi:uncharacterized protein F4817DRAFT_277780 [Daldinia loculata]|uniref:uncharacterized protein n=1 Tax=Daldinia loculata TaxID=103429 RepID=UPI0020C52B53|nr:uncharacterized protein F4817DRAFT_277780 [Daldinia loculata]KAI1642846.1 hypothetical protein F4817DRAFT_277780 [Daldinia loculata]